MITIPADAKESGLVIDFNDHPDLRPKWLGRSNCRPDYDFLESRTRLSAMNVAAPPPPDKILSFREFIEAAADATRQKSKAIRQKKKEERVVKQQDMGRSFKRTQRYLGLRPRTTSDGTWPPLV
jgi:hypothetical protein